MENLNGLKYTLKTVFSWDNLEKILEEELNCSYLSVNECERFENDVIVKVDILDTSKGVEIKNTLKKYIDNDSVGDIKGMFDDIDYICEKANVSDVKEHYTTIDNFRLEESITKKMIENHLNKTYNINVKVLELEGTFYKVNVDFETI